MIGVSYGADEREVFFGYFSDIHLRSWRGSVEVVPHEEESFAMLAKRFSEGTAIMEEVIHSQSTQEVTGLGSDVLRSQGRGQGLHAVAAIVGDDGVGQ